MLMDRFLPSSEWAMAPLTRTVNVIQDFQSYQSLYDQNQQLRRELQQMKSWKEAALQLEQENARLLDLNKLQLDAQLTWISGIVRADSGSLSSIRAVERWRPRWHPKRLGRDGRTGPCGADCRCR